MTIGTPPPYNSGPALQDGLWLNGLANGGNKSYVNNLVAHAGGTKAAALQIPAGVAIVRFATVATNSDSALLPQAIAGTVVCVRNAGGATLSLFGRGTDTINGGATASNYDLATNTSAIFFCGVNGDWSAVKTA